MRTDSLHNLRATSASISSRELPLVQTFDKFNSERFALLSSPKVPQFRRLNDGTALFDELARQALSRGGCRCAPERQVRVPRDGSF